MVDAPIANTSPSSSTRVNPVNVMYEEWKKSSESEQEAVLHRLDPMLQRHAERVVWMVLRQTNTQLVREMVDDLKMDLASFNGKSQFSTWVHARYRYRCIDELRFRRKFIGESLEAQTQLFREEHEPIAQDPAIDDQIHLEQILSRLEPRLQTLVEARMRGETLEEIGNRHGLTKAGVLHLMREVQERLATETG